MKKCLNCNIDVGGNIESCPLCQNSLVGEATMNNWPSPEKLKTQAFFYKLQLFLVLTATVITLALDFLLEINNGQHYSLIITMWLITFEMMLADFIKRNLVVSKIVSVSIFYVCVMSLVTSWFYDFLEPVAYIAIPIMVSVALLLNLIFSIIDTSHNALIYLLANILVIILVYAYFTIARKNAGLTWTISLMLGIITFIGIIVFKGKRVTNEIEKRMNF